MNTLLQNRDKEIVRLARSIFQYDSKDWGKIKDDFSPRQVKEFYEQYEKIWNISTKPEMYLQESRGLTALYLGDADPRKLVRSVNGSLLFTDKVLIVDPFVPVWCINPEHNPIYNAEKYTQDTLRLLYFLRCITPLLEAGYAHLLPNPEMYDHKLRLSSWNSAERRFDRSKKLSPVFQKAFDEELPTMEERITDQFILSPEDWWVRIGREMKIKEEDIKLMVSHVRKIRMTDPTILSKSDLREMGSQIFLHRQGLNLESTLYVSELTNAYPLTYSRFKWEEFKSVKEELTEQSYWMEVSRAIQELPLGFLDTTQGHTIVSLRNEGAVSNFRVLLAEIKKSRESKDELSGDAVRDIKDQLHSAYNTALTDYRSIDENLLKGSLGEIGAIITGSLAIDLAKIAPAGLDLLRQLKTSSGKRQAFNNTSPMAMFVELSKKKFAGIEYGHKN
jgi:hypothetical protein